MYKLRVLLIDLDYLYIYYSHVYMVCYSTKQDVETIIFQPAHTFPFGCASGLYFPVRFCYL